STASTTCRFWRTPWRRPAAPTRRSWPTAAPAASTPAAATSWTSSWERAEGGRAMDTESLRAEVQRDVGEVTRDFPLGRPSAPRIRGVGPARLPLWRQAAAAGVAEAWWLLGCCHEHGLGVPADAAEAVRCYRAGAEAGDPRAQNNLGACYDAGV